MKLKNIIITLFVIFSLIGLLIYIDPTTTGFAVQDRFLINNVSVSAKEFNQQVKVEQFDDYEIKMDNALYYFTANVEKEQAIDYLLLEFEVDNTQLREFNKEDVSLYFYKDGWIKEDTEFIKEYGRYNYYRAKGEGFGLYAVALRKQEKQAVTPKISEDDIILYGLAPILAILLLFSIFSYGSVKLIQKLNYRIYLFLKRGFIGLIKFSLSFGIVVLILGILSPEQSGVSGKDIVYYALIPMIALTLFMDLFLNFFLWVHRLVQYNRVYRFFRNFFGLFVVSLTLIFGLLIKVAPKAEGTVTRADLILYGLLPIICMNFIFVLVVYAFYILVRKALFVKKI